MFRNTMLEWAIGIDRHLLVLSVKLDEWTDEQVEALAEMGGNTVANKKYESRIPNNLIKPKPNLPIEEHIDFIRRKYDKLQLLNTNEPVLFCPFPSPSPSLHRHTSPSQTTSSSQCSSNDKKQHEKWQLDIVAEMYFETAGEEKILRIEIRTMVEFVGLIKVNVVRGTNLAIRDVMTSDPSVVLVLVHQLVFDKDTFSTDDFTGDAEINIQPLVSATQAYEMSTINESMQLGKWIAGQDNTLVEDGTITLVDGKVKQVINLLVQNIETGAGN